MLQKVLALLVAVQQSSQSRPSSSDQVKWEKVLALLVAVQQSSQSRPSSSDQVKWEIEKSHDFSKPEKAVDVLRCEWEEWASAAVERGHNENSSSVRLLKPDPLGFVTRSTPCENQEKKDALAAFEGQWEIKRVAPLAVAEVFEDETPVEDDNEPTYQLTCKIAVTHPKATKSVLTMLDDPDGSAAVIECFVSCPKTNAIFHQIDGHVDLRPLNSKENVPGTFDPFTNLLLSYTRTVMSEKLFCREWIAENQSFVESSKQVVALLKEAQKSTEGRSSFRDVKDSRLGDPVLEGPYLPGSFCLFWRDRRIGDNDEKFLTYELVWFAPKGDRSDPKLLLVDFLRHPSGNRASIRDKGRRKLGVKSSKSRKFVKGKKGRRMRRVKSAAAVASKRLKRHLR